jgi:Homeodomain-like domain
VDLNRAADLYAQGWTLRQIGAELGVHWSTVSEQLHRSGVKMRSNGPPAHPASTEQILELRDQGLTWNEIAEQVDMTASGVWSRYRRARLAETARLGRWQQVLADALDENLAIGVRAAVTDHLVDLRTGLSSPPHDELPTVSPPLVVLACFTCRVLRQTTMQATATILCWRSRM